MEFTLFQVDAFASKPFEGNPAAVCPLDEWLSDDIMQSIAEENNLSETAFFVPFGSHYQIRWFTPKAEVDLCGHATLAAAYVLFNIKKFPGDTITFQSRSGKLEIRQHENWFVMNFPSQPGSPCEIPKEISHAFNNRPIDCLRSEDYLVVFENENDVAILKPDFKLLEKLDLRGVIKKVQIRIASNFHQIRYISQVSIDL